MPKTVSGSQTHLGVEIDFQSSSRCVEGRNLRNIVILAFTFILQFEGDTMDGPTLDTLHQMSGETRNIVGKMF